MEDIILQDDATGSRAHLLPAFGFNCYRFQAMLQGRPLEVLWSAEGFTSGKERPSGSGIPLLFPFPGRIGGGRFDFGGRTYELPTGDGRGNAIHGFVIDRPWQVVEQSKGRVVGRFLASAADPALLTRWPGDFSLTVTYTLQGNTLRSDFEVANPGPGRLPFALGTHPYFRLPADTPEQAQKCLVQVPASSAWELIDLLPTGRRLTSDVAQRLRQGMPFSETKLDDVFTGLEAQKGAVAASIKNPADGRTIGIRCDASFANCVVYNPPHRQAICIEPYGCVPDPFRLSAAGIDAGLRVLGPAETFRTWVEITAT